MLGVVVAKLCIGFGVYLLCFLRILNLKKYFLMRKFATLVGLSS